MIRQNLSHQLITIGLIFVFTLGCNSLTASPSTVIPISPTATPRPPTATRTRIPPTKTPSPPTTTPCPPEPSLKTTEDVREIENLILQTIFTEGVGERLVIEELKPERPVIEGGVTIMGSQGTVIISPTFPGDLTLPDDFNAAQIWRYSGDVREGEFTFVGESDSITNLLTFAKIMDVGFVYLRGRGRVIFPDGTEIRLGC